MHTIHTPIPLHLLPEGTRGIVRVMTSKGLIRRRMLDLGFTLDAEIEVLQKNPFGDPVAYLIRGVVIALRNEEAATLLVVPQ
jgi:ferrous iron transport protein A